MPDAHSVRVAEILAEFGASPGWRLWPNKTMGLWAGEQVGSTRGGHIVLRHARLVKVGLFPGSADLVGIRQFDGKFLGIEVKTGKARPNAQQRRWLKLINDFNGIAGVARSTEDVAKLLRL